MGNSTITFLSAPNALIVIEGQIEGVEH